MSSINHLQILSRKYHEDANNKRHLAQSLYTSADSHEAHGDQVQADLDRKSAQKYEDEAIRIEQQAGVTDKQIMLAMKKKHDLESELKHLEREYTSKLNNLKGEIGKLEA